MKKLMMLAITGLLFTSAKAQVNNVIITNYTSLPVYVVFHGDVTSSGCSNNYTSNIKQIGPSASFTANTSNTTLLFSGNRLGPGDEIIGVDIYDGWSFCTPTFIDYIGESCFSPNTSTGSPYTTNDNSCFAAGTVSSIVWANIGGGNATLDIY